MLSNLSFKQKVICGGILAVMLFIIGLYGYTKLNEEKEEIITNSQDFISTNHTNDIVENQVEEQNSNAKQEEKIIVHITGEIKNSGILELPVGARIADAITAAGGATDNADLEQVNLAYELQDGQKIYISSKEDKEIVYITSESGDNVIVGENSQGVNQKVNINQAGQEELQELPGIGPALAMQIIQYRNTNGKFSKIEDLQNVKGIGDAKFNNIKEYVTVK